MRIRYRYNTQIKLIVKSHTIVGILSKGKCLSYISVDNIGTLTYEQTIVSESRAI